MPKTDIRALILHEFSLGRKPMQALQNITQSKGPGVVSRRTVERWYAKFRDGNENVEDAPRSGRPVTIDEDAVLAAIEADPTLSTRMLAEDFDCSHVQIFKILHKLGKRVRKGRWVPHELTQQQKNRRLEAAQQLLQRHQETPFLDRIVTCDEKWCSYKNPKNKKQWLTPGQPSVSTPKPDWRQRRALLCVWWWRGGVIHWKTVPHEILAMEIFYNFYFID
uniref:Mos1 transposase HTH domain-containing protein n=1 Tax=Globodera rostochiensis TaxID=31243 RepID=A0A914H673_GLORO